MLKQLDKILSTFEGCFSRKASFQWFVVVVLGLMVRSDHLGTTSIIRDLSLNPIYYESLNHFFRSSAWTVELLSLNWFRVVKQFAPLYKVKDAVVLVGDGIKVSKEAQYMPGVKKLFQESQNSSKESYIFGHLFGAVGILMGTPQKLFCLPLLFQLQDGVKTIFSWNKNKVRQSSHVVQMIDQGFTAAKTFGKAIFLLDRYFLSVSALERLKELSLKDTTIMHIVTRAKLSCVAYRKPGAKRPGRGRPRIKGTKVKLRELFSTHAHEFQNAKVLIYGKQETVDYLCFDLLWGQKLYQELRFVLVKHKGQVSILVSTDLSLDATTIISLYGYRFKIECTFREMKQCIGGLAYRFWTKSMPKINRYSRSGEANQLEQVTSEKDRVNIQATIKAIEGYVMCSSIAMGLLQLLSIHYSHRTPALFLRYLRTPSKAIVSEATVMAFLRKTIFYQFTQNPCLTITLIIKSRQLITWFDGDSMAS